ncbi:MAG: hypothetical protein JST00_14925 [Deltaproteobacteria bacterium]|nr:hypothetical protein [Deltaproteobacteria bacterium]
MSIRRFALLLSCALLGAACSRSVDGPSRPPAEPSARDVPAAPGSTSEALSMLRTANAFEDAHIGYGAQLSRYVAAFRIVLADPGAKEAFHSLVKDATPAGRLYGVSGLYFADPAAFDAALAEVAKLSGRVQTQHGCMIEHEEIASVVRATGEPRIEVAEGQTLRDAILARRGDPHGSACDIAGGCVPLSFVHDGRPAPRPPAR